jgi:hypothetical protein
MGTKVVVFQGAMVMGTKLGQRLGAVLGVALLAGACSGSSKTDPSSKGDKVCEAGAVKCNDLDVAECSDDGTQWVVQRRCVESCSDGVCSGGSVPVGSAGSGSGPGPGVCTDTTCTQITCLANTKFCQDGSVWKCDASGSSSKLSQTCAKSQFCREGDDTASCTDQTCTPGQALCDGDFATKCDADGTGPVKGGLDCAANKQTCIDGDCQDTKCIPGAKVCQNEDVYLCAKNGTDTSLLADCQAGSVCDGEKLACTPKVCNIGSVGCDGTRAVKCNAYGSAWDPAATDCAADNKVCVAGSCKEQVCAPNGRFCQNGNVFLCDQDGLSSSLYQTCTPNYYHCTPYPSGNYATCDANQCQPNQKLCDNNVVRICNADGSWPSEGSACGNDEFCESGTCKARVCEPGQIFCKDGDVYGCDWIGSRADLYQQCPTDTTCKVNDGSYSCIPMPCSPGEVACLGNKVGTCAADGQSLSKVTEDCTTSASICGNDNKCSKSVVDVLGADEPNGDISEASGYFIGDVIEVSSARKLTEMQLNLSLPPPRTVRWVVFEQTADTNFTAKQDWVVSNQSGSGFFSSGPISYALKTGKTYLFGAVITGGNTFTAYLDTGPFAVNASFGTVLGRVENPYSSTMGAWIDTGYLYQMKLTTAP